MQEIARHLIDWCSELSSRGEKNALNILVPNYFDESTTDIKQLSEHFNFAYKLALEDVSFILNQSGNLAKQDEIIIDKTGLSGVLGEQAFCKIIGTEKQLPSANIDNSILSKKLFDHIDHIELDNIIDGLIDNKHLNSWYVLASEENKNVLHKWLFDNKGACKSLIKSLPIFRFGCEWKSRNDIDENPNLIITTEYIMPIREILSKLGYKCSDELLGGNPLMECIDSQIEKKLFDDIASRLVKCNFTPNEKLTLIISMADFYEVGKNTIEKINLFCNLNRIQTPLRDMLAYKEDAPDWLKPYVLCQEENFPELTEYLICNEFDVAWKHFDEIGISATDLYNRYKWSDGTYTKKLIDKYKNTEDFQQILGIVEESDKFTKRYYLDKIANIKLLSDKLYKKDSFEYRVLQLALNVFENQPSNFSSKIFFDQQCIKNFSITDEVICKYSQSDGLKRVNLSLSKLLPQYQNQSDSIEKIKSLFESEKDLDKFFDAKPKPINEVYIELNTLLNIPHAMYDPWMPGSGNAIQYMFSVYQRKQSWPKVRGLKIDLSKESEEFIAEMMDFLFENQIDIKSSPFTYHTHQYFSNMYFDNEYIFEEQLLPAIEKWVDDDEKRNYLIKNGIRSTTHDSIKFRQLFKENKPIDFIEKLSNEDIIAGLSYFMTAEGLKGPFIGKNQISILNNIKSRKNCSITTSFNTEKLSTESEEWNSAEYTEWRKEHFPQFFLFHNQMPKGMYYGTNLLMEYNEEDYYYDKQNQTLFINKNKHIDDLLFEIAKEGKTNFDLDDYKILCVNGKVTISKSDLEQKDKTISDLEIENERLKSFLEEQGFSESDIRNNINTTENKNPSTPPPSQIELINSVITKPDLSQEKQIAAHKEAEQVIKEKLEQKGYDCSAWILDKEIESNDYKKWHSDNQIEKLIKNPNGETINLVVKSAKGGYIYLSAADFEFLTSDGSNVLMVWDGNQVHSVTGEQIFNKDSNVNLIFDAEYTPKHYYAALSRVFQFVKRTTFAVKNPKYSAYEEVQSFGMDAKADGIQELFDDNDI